DGRPARVQVRERAEGRDQEALRNGLGDRHREEREQPQHPEVPLHAVEARAGSETGGARGDAGPPAPALCVGETLVDLICERPVSAFDEADSFRPHPGGAPTNVAVQAARAGASVALAGGAGDDAWGRWLQRRLEEEGVDLRFWRLLPGEETAIAFAVLDRDAVPEFLIYGDGIRAAMTALEAMLEDAVRASSARVLGSDRRVR